MILVPKLRTCLPNLRRYLLLKSGGSRIHIHYRTLIGFDELENLASGLIDNFFDDYQLTNNAKNSVEREWNERGGNNCK